MGSKKQKFQGQLHSLETYDGNVYVAAGDDVWLSYGGYGAPTTRFFTRRGYRQDGYTLVDYRLEQRAVKIDLYRTPVGDDRQEYWDERLRLHEFLRPNRGGPIKFTLRLPEGELRSLLVVADPGMMFAEEENNAWDIDERVRFIAHDPVWFDPDTHTLAETATEDEELVFPITFDDANIIFGLEGLLFSSALVYPGTWKSFPTITLTGPYTLAIIRNSVLPDTVVQMVQPIAAGQQRVIDLTPGAQTITDGGGTSYFNELSPGSNLIDFAIYPDPTAPGGVQTLSLVLADAVLGQSAAVVQYNDRYFAL